MNVWFHVPLEPSLLLKATVRNQPVLQAQSKMQLDSASDALRELNSTKLPKDAFPSAESTRSGTAGAFAPKDTTSSKAHAKCVLSTPFSTINWGSADHPAESTKFIAPL